MSRQTEAQRKWYRMHNDTVKAERAKLGAEIAKHLSDAFEDMSELENLLNSGMEYAGHDTYALSRNDLNRKREEIKHMASQFGMRSSSYPLRLIGGDYSSLEE